MNTPAMSGADRGWQDCTADPERILTRAEARMARNRPGSRVITGSRPTGQQAGVESIPGDIARGVKTETHLGEIHHE